LREDGDHSVDLLHLGKYILLARTLNR